MIEPIQLRQALGQFVTGVTVITTCDASGTSIGVTASSFNAVSLEPPLVLWSLGKQAYSYPMFSRAGHFAVHVLGEHQKSLSDRFAKASTNKFSGIPLDEGIGGIPLLLGCPARFECSVEHRYDGGDHLILVGRVQRLELAEEGVRPLLFHRGRYLALAGD